MSYKNKLLPYQKEGIVEVGIDEAGRGCLFGRVYIAGVILPNDILELCEESDIIIKDSKKMSDKRKEQARTFIESVAIDYSVAYKENDYIDTHNILASTLKGMHEVINNLQIKPDKILVDGDRFKIYRDSNGELVEHECVVDGDNTYMSIAAASILAKCAKDQYIVDIVNTYPDLNKYDLLNNSGYGTQKHIDAIHKYGISQYHRKTFGICKDN
jgi:ribonuclease HII